MIVHRVVEDALDAFYIASAIDEVGMTLVSITVGTDKKWHVWGQGSVSRGLNYDAAGNHVGIPVVDVDEVAEILRAQRERLLEEEEEDS